MIIAIIYIYMNRWLPHSVLMRYILRRLREAGALVILSRSAKLGHTVPTNEKMIGVEFYHVLHVLLHDGHTQRIT